jgi:hypothetical protein
MAKYRFTRDFSANGTAPNNAIAPAGQIPPKWIYLTKKFKKGEIIEAGIATENSTFGSKGESIAFKTLGATTTQGVPYSDLALLYIPIENNGALEEIDDNGNVINKSTKEETFLQKNKNNLIIAVVLVAGYFAYKKYKK